MIERMENIDVEAALKAAHSRIAVGRRKRMLRSLERVAACLALPFAVVSAYFAYDYYTSSNEEVPVIEVRSTSGMVSCTTLPDGSKVWLNSNSILRYPSRFTEDDRDVVLDGEAFFSVTKQDGRKFNVRAGDVLVEVRGTQFNVEAYSKKNGEIRTTLVEGKVNLYCANRDGETVCHEMNPGERLTYDKVSETATISTINPRTASAWKDGQICFDNTTLGDALRLVGNRFNIEFVVKNEALLSNRYTGTLTTQGLEAVMEYFRQTTRIHFEPVSGGAIYLVY